MAQATTGHLLKAPACRVTGRRAFRRSTAAICYAVTVLLRRTGGIYRSRYPGSIGAALHPASRSHLRQPPHRGRTVTAPPGTRVRTSPAGAASPLRHRTPPEGALSERGRCAPYVKMDGRQAGPLRLQGPSTSLPTPTRNLVVRSSDLFGRATHMVLISNQKFLSSGTKLGTWASLLLENSGNMVCQAGQSATSASRTFPCLRPPSERRTVR
jgi:hypothetical protein